MDTPDPKALVRLAGNRKTPPDQLTDLAAHPHPPVRRAVGGNPATPADVLARLAADPVHTVPKAVARNPHTPVPALVDLFLHGNDVVAQLVVERPEWPVDLQWAGARSDNPTHRWQTARRRDLDPAVRDHLAADPDETVLYHLVSVHGADLPDATLDRLADADHRGLRGAVAEVTRTPAVLQRLLTEDHPIVLSGAVKNPLLTTADLADIVARAPRDLRYNGSVLFALRFAPHLTPELDAAIEVLLERRPFV